MRNTFAALTGFATLCLTPFVGAQEALQEAQADPSSDLGLIETMVVEATRLGQRKAEAGSSISVLTAEDLEMLGKVYVLDAIAQVPGVTINQNGAFGGNAGVRIRGAASEQTLVLIDGIPVNDPSSPGGGFNFARMDSATVERIEVLKGPQSTLWGTDAIGGVVAITTKKAADRLAGDLFAEYGSFDTLRAGGSVSNRSDAGDFRLAAISSTSDGISKADAAEGNSETDAFESLTLAANGGLNLPRGARLTADFLWTDAETEFDSFTFSAVGRVSDGDEVSETEEVASNLSLTFPLLRGRLDNQLLVGYSDIQRENFTDGLSSFDATGDRLLLRYQGTLTANERHRVAFGVEREETNANEDGTSIDGLFALYELSPSNELSITVGLRNDDHERYDAVTTGRVATSWRMSDTLALRASWGEGFKAPTIFQTTFFCCGAEAPNADLEPETSEAFDLGVDWRLLKDRLQFSATLFRQDTENLIDFDFALGGYFNVAEVESRGLELAGELSLPASLRLTVDYAYIDAKDGDGAPLTRLPEHSGDLTLSYDAPGRFSTALLLRYNGSEQNTDGTVLDRWWRVDLTGRYALSERVELYGRIENLFDEDYQQILGYGTPGVSGSLGLRMRF